MTRTAISPGWRSAPAAGSPVGPDPQQRGPCAANSAFATQNSATTPATPAGTEFISFIVSTMPITVSAPTWLPTSTNGAAPGRGAR